MSDGTTDDAFLGGRVRLRQPAAAYRAGLDAVLLAAAAPAHPGERVLDIGAGVGAVSLALAARVPGVAVTALELQPGLAALARENAARNGLAEDVRVICADALARPSPVPGNAFDHVLSNPPFLAAGEGTPAPDAAKALAHVESGAGLQAWLRFCLRCARPGGTVALVHRAERLPDLLRGLHGPAGDIRICPLWPKRGRAAKRLLLLAVKGARGPLRLLPGLLLHREDGSFTPKAEAILRDAAPLALTTGGAERAAPS